MRLFTLPIIVLVGLLSISLIQEVSAQNPFDSVRDIYFSDQAEFGETRAMLSMLVCIGDRLDRSLNAPISKAAWNFHFEEWELEKNLMYAEGERRRELEKQLAEFRLQSCKEMLKLVEPEQLVLQVQRTNLKYLKRCNKKDRNVDPTFLTNHDLTDRLELSAKQKKGLQEQHLKISKIQRDMWLEFNKAYGQLTEVAIDEINQILDSKQQQKFKKRIGAPVNWPKSIEYRGSFEYLFQVSNPNARRGRLRLDFKPKKPLDDLDEREIIDFYLVKILSANFMLDEIEVTDDQAKDLSQILVDYRNHHHINDSESQERFEALVAGEQLAYPKKLEELFLDHQIKCLRQVELQVRTGAFRSSFGLLHPYIVDELDLSRRQVKEIERISRRLSSEVDAFTEETKAQIIKLMRADYLNTMKLLTAKQLDRYTLLTGLDTSSFKSR